MLAVDWWLSWYAGAATAEAAEVWARQYRGNDDWTEAPNCSVFASSAADAYLGRFHWFSGSLPFANSMLMIVDHVWTGCDLSAFSGRDWMLHAEVALCPAVVYFAESQLLKSWLSSMYSQSLWSCAFVVSTLRSMLTWMMWVLSTANADAMAAVMNFVASSSSLTWTWARMSSTVDFEWKVYSKDRPNFPVSPRPSQICAKYKFKLKSIHV